MNEEAFVDAPQRVEARRRAVELVDDDAIQVNIKSYLKDGKYKNDKERTSNNNNNNKTRKLY